MNRQDKKSLSSPAAGQSPKTGAPRPPAWHAAAAAMALLPRPRALRLRRRLVGDGRGGGLGRLRASGLERTSPGTEAATVSATEQAEAGRHDLLRARDGNAVPDRRLDPGGVHRAPVRRHLVSQTKGGKIVPWLATSWTTSKDGLTWTFKLKPGVKFTNGEPLNAQRWPKTSTSGRTRTTSTVTSELHRRLLQVGESGRRPRPSR